MTRSHQLGFHAIIEIHHREKPMRYSLPSSSHKPIAELDGIRGLAIVMVVYYHFVGQFETRQNFESVFFQLSQFGSRGVDLFFVLSGLLITWRLRSTRDKSRYFSSFYWRRFFRIVPLFYSCLVVVAILTWVLLPANSSERAFLFQYLALSAVFLSNFAIISAKVFPPLGTAVFWSLAIEEQFYLVWPWVVRYFNAHRLRLFCLSLCLIAFVSRWALLANSFSYFTIYVSPVTRVDCLALGALLALDFEPKRLEHWGLPASFLLLVSVNLWLRAADADPLRISVSYAASAFFFFNLVLRALASPPQSYLRKALRFPSLVWIGKRSFAIYLFHSMVLSASKKLLPTLSVPPLHFRLIASQLVVYLAALALLAYASWHLLEKNLLRWAHQKFR